MPDEIVTQPTQPTHNQPTNMDKPTPNQIERERLQAELDLANREAVRAHHHGTEAEQISAGKAQRQALNALVAFNLRTIRMVPVTAIRL